MSEETPTGWKGNDWMNDSQLKLGHFLCATMVRELCMTATSRSIGPYVLGYVVAHIRRYLLAASSGIAFAIYVLATMYYA